MKRYEIEGIRELLRILESFGDELEGILPVIRIPANNIRTVQKNRLKNKDKIRINIL